MKASKESSSRLCPLGDVSLSAARWGVWGVASRVSDTARVSGGYRGGAPPGVLASARRARFARGAAPAQSWLMVGGGCPHTRCPALGLQIPCQAGQRSTPRRLRVPLCPVGRHSALPAAQPPCQVPPLVFALVSVAVAPAFLPRPPQAPRAAVGLAVQAAGLHRSLVALPLGRGFPPRAAAQVGFPGPRAAGRPPGPWCCAGSGPGPWPGAG